jgi:hypothetical protein
VLFCLECSQDFFVASSILIDGIKSVFVEMMRRMASSGRTLDSCEGVLAFLMLAKVFLLANGCCSGLEMLRNSQKLSFP